MNDIMFNLLQAVFVAAVAAIVRYLIPLLITHLRQSRFDLAADIIEHLVHGAEQVIIAAGSGPERHDLVQRLAHEILPQYGITLTEEQISMLIESAVFAMNAETTSYIEVPVEIQEEDPEDEREEL